MITAPYGTLPLWLDKNRAEEPEHIREVAMKILNTSPEGFQLEDWCGLLREQLYNALEINPYSNPHNFHDQWDWVLCGLIDTRLVDFDFGSGMVRAKNDPQS